MAPDAREVLDALQVSDARRYPAGEVSDARSRRAEVSDTRRSWKQGRTWAEGKGRRRDRRIGRADLYQTRGAIRRADTKQETIGRDGTRRTGGIGRAADIRRAEVSRGGGIRRAEKRIGCRAVRGRGGRGRRIDR